MFAHYNMVDIPESSEKIEAEIRQHVAQRIAGHHLELGRIALQHIDYPPAVQQAIELRALTNPASKYVFVPEGRQLSVVLGGDASTAATAH